MNFLSGDIEFIKNNYKNLSHKEIADKLNRTEKSVKSYCQRNRLLKKIYKFDINEKFFDEWSSDMAWILGYTMSDGYIQSSIKDSRFQLSFSIQKRDIEVLNFINSKLDTDKKFNFYKGIVNAKYTSKYMIQKLIELGVIQRKTGLESIPKNLPKEYFWDFLRGYFDGDGSISILKKNKRLANFYICSESKDILDDFCKITGVGRVIDVSKYKKLEKSFYIWKEQKQENLTYLYNKIYYNDSNFKLKRKYDTFSSYINTIK